MSGLPELNKLNSQGLQLWRNAWRDKAFSAFRRRRRHGGYFVDEVKLRNLKRGAIDAGLGGWFRRVVPGSSTV